MISIITFLLTAFIYLRYATFEYKTSAIIEILDESQESEMALPSALTVFNRSMVNLENEINILNSFSLHSKVINDLKQNVSAFTVGKIKTTQVFPQDLFKDYEIEYKTDLTKVDSLVTFEINLTTKIVLL